MADINLFTQSVNPAQVFQPTPTQLIAQGRGPVRTDTPTTRTKTNSNIKNSYQSYMQPISMSDISASNMPNIIDTTPKMSPAPKTQNVFGQNWLTEVQAGKNVMGTSTFTPTKPNPFTQPAYGLIPAKESKISPILNYAQSQSFTPSINNFSPKKLFAPKQQTFLQETAIIRPEYTTQVPVLTGLNPETDIVMKEIKTTVPVDLSKTMKYPLPGYLDTKGEVNIGYAPLPKYPIPEGMQGKNFLQRVGYGVTHPGEVFKTLPDIDKAIFNPYYSNVAYQKQYMTGSRTPEFIERGQKATFWSGLGGIYNLASAPFRSGPQAKDALKQIESGFLGVSQVRSAGVLRDIKLADYERRKNMTNLQNDAKKNVIELLKFQSENPDLNKNIESRNIDIITHNQSVNNLEKEIQDHKTRQAEYTKKLNNYESTLKSIGTLDPTTNTYLIEDGAALVQLKMTENDLNQQAKELNDIHSNILSKKDILDKETQRLDSGAEVLSGPMGQYRSLKSDVFESTKKVSEYAPEMQTAWQLGMTSPESTRYQVGDIASMVGTTGAKTAILAELGVFKGISNVAGVVGANVPAAAVPALSGVTTTGILGLGGLNIYSRGKQYSELYKGAGLSSAKGAVVGALGGLAEFGLATDIASQGQLSLFKGYQVRDIQGKLVGGGLDVQNPFSGSLSSTKPLFSYGRGIKLFGYAAPKTTGVPIDLLGKQQTAFLKANLPAGEQAYFSDVYSLYGQAKASPQRIEGKQYTLDISKAENLKGLSKEELALIKKFGTGYAEQTTGPRAYLNAATNTGPKQFMGSSADTAKKLLAFNKIRAGKMGDIDVDFYSGAQSEGYRVTEALNALGKHQWQFDPNLGKVYWGGKPANTVFNFLGEDIPGAYLKYTPLGSLPKPSEYIGYKTPTGKIAKVATKSYVDSFMDKIQTGALGQYVQQGGVGKLVVSPDKFKSVADFDSFIKALSKKGIIATPEAGYWGKILTGRNVNLDLSGKQVITRTTPTPLIPASYDVSSSQIGTFVAPPISQLSQSIGSSTLLTSMSEVSRPSSVSSVSSSTSSASASSASSTSSDSSGSDDSSGGSSGSSGSSSDSSGSSGSSSSSSSGTGLITGIGFPGFIAPIFPGFPGDSGRAGRSGTRTGGVNVNFLRNFFFEKVKQESPLKGKNIMFSEIPTSLKVSKTTPIKKDVFAKSFNMKIASNSTPFPKMMQLKVKEKKRKNKELGMLLHSQDSAATLRRMM